MRLTIAAISLAALLLASCGDDSGGGGLLGSGDAGPTVTGAAGARTAGIEPCSLFTDAELIEVLGEAPPAEESAPAGPFTGCSWGTGEVLVSIATTESIILAPGENECPSAGLGDESYACEDRVKFLTDGIHASVSTIDAFVTDDQLLALAQVLLPKLQS